MDSQLNELEYLLHKCKLEKDIEQKLAINLQIIEMRAQLKEQLVAENKIFAMIFRLKMVGLL